MIKMEYEYNEAEQILIEVNNEVSDVLSEIRYAINNDNMNKENSDELRERISETIEKLSNAKREIEVK